jgi:diguanylate cyclase (GGDEF)-like protein
MAMESFVAVLAGLALLYGWWQSRDATALLPWAASSILISFGIYDLYMGSSSGNPAWFAVGTFSLSLAGGLAWAAIRIFSGRPAPILLTAAGAALSVAAGIAGSAGVVPQSVVSSVPLVTGGVYYAAGAVTLWQGRSERIAARVPMIALLAIHVLVMAVGAYGTLSGVEGSTLMAPLGTAFSVIHFESIVFTIGTAAFFLVMTRERKELHSRRAAYTDGLTGIANRQSFMEGAERMLARAKRSKEPLAVVMFDLDHFKAINDGHGHSTGDQVIRQFVRVVRDAMRPTDLFGRIGGEEFALALPGVDADTAFARADRIRIEFCRSSFATVNEEILSATVSAGISAGSGATIAALLADADDALYRAKAAGRNRVVKAGGPGKGKTVLRVA